MRRLLLLLAVAVTACSRAGSDNAFSWTTPLEPGAVVHIRDGAGEITVKRAASGTAAVRGSRTWRRGRSSDIKFVVNQVGTDYYICAMWRNSGRCGASGYRGRNTSSFLSIFSLFHRGSDASADFDVELPAGVTLDARTSTGSINIDGATAGVSAHTLNGTIRADGVAGALDLQTTNGDVRVSIDSTGAADPIRLQTTNGSVHADLPADLQGLYDLSVVNGVVHSDVSFAADTSGVVGRHLQGRIGASSRDVKLRAINGMVTLTKRTIPPARTTP